ncbi:nucleoside-diphosphate-sugar epimerase [Oxalobacteraceae bacterium GrIS 1.11]
MKSVLVTGATGGLGRNAVRILQERGVAVRATGRNAQVGAELARQGARFVALDLALATPAQLAALLDGVDAVWHCAALSAPWGAPADFAAANVDATAALLEAAGQAGVGHFVHISTPALYFDFHDRAEVPESFRPARYVNDYARTKAQAEQLVQAGVTRFPAMQCVILRPRAIFGPHDQVLMPRVAALIERGGGRLALPKGGTVTLDVTYVDNVVQAMWLASVNPALASGSVFNITNQEPAQLRDILRSLFQDGLGRPLRIVALPYPLLAGVARLLLLLARVTGREPALTPYSLGAVSFSMTLDNNLARRQLGYEPAVSLAEGIRRTALWMQQHG